MFESLSFFELLIPASLGGGVVYLYMRLKAFKQKQYFKKFDKRDAKNQMRFIEEAELYKRNPINKEAYRIFRSIEMQLPKRPRYRLLAEVSMGAFLGTSKTGNIKRNQRAFSAFGSKRVDFLVIDEFGQPVVAVEYQGTGHFQGDAPLRDAVKKRALQKAGVQLLEVEHDSKEADYLNQLIVIVENHKVSRAA